MSNRRIIKRGASRSPTEAMVTCRPYVSHSSIQTTDGIMRNFSILGSYVETSGKYESGTILIVRMLRYSPVICASAGDNQPRTIGLAEVKWCRVLAKGDGHRYGMGLKYLD